MMFQNGNQKKIMMVWKISLRFPKTSMNNNPQKMLIIKQMSRILKT